MDIVDESCRNKCINVFDSLIRGEEVGNNETVFISRSGEKIAVEGRCRTTFHNGKPVAMTGFFRDISDRIKNTAALRESEQRFRTLFENSSDIMQIVAPDGHFLHVNPAWLRAFGYTRAEIKNLTIFDLISPDCQEHCQSVFHQVITQVGSHKIDTVFIAKNGKRVEIEGNATAIFKDGEVVHSQCVFRDVTELRKNHRELLKAHKLESIGVFAGGLAHDFNNLLTAILGNISLAREAVDISVRSSGEAMRKADEAEQSAKAAAEESVRESQLAAERAEKAGQSASETAETASKAAREAADESIRIAQEKAEEARKIAEEAVTRAEEASKTAKETTEASTHNMKEVAEASRPYLWLARGMILTMAVFIIWGVWYAWRRHPRYFEGVESENDAEEADA